MCKNNIRLIWNNIINNIIPNDINLVLLYLFVLESHIVIEKIQNGEMMGKEWVLGHVFI